MPRFSATVVEHFQSPQNYRVTESADAVGVSGVPGQGRFFAIYLKCDDAQIRLATFQCHGCGATIACGSVLTKMIVGRSCRECRGVSAGQLLAALEGLPPDKRHCAALAVNAMYDALNQWENRSAN